MSITHKCVWCSNAASEFSLIHNNIAGIYRVEILCDAHNGIIRTYVGDTILCTCDTYEAAELEMLRRKL